jgi:phosphoglucosamine mutase
VLAFGTDGVRGEANSKLTPEEALLLGRAAARSLGSPTILVGRDTRRSGTLIEAAFSAGVASEGVEVVQLGVVPTPAVAWRCGVDQVAGAMVSASHNPFGDNGIKLFGVGGRKLPDAVEHEVDAVRSSLDAAGSSRPVGGGVGTVSRLPEALLDGYVEWLASTVPSLDGLSIVVDCANGAASPWAFRALAATGAKVQVVHDRPDGCNINDRCGATHPESLSAAVVESGADVGLALDGDADRLVAVAADGSIVDGDHVIALCALDRHRRGVLAHDSVVVTVMANLGFRKAMQRNDIAVVETAVGDRYVLDALDAGGFVLGGEQSGHVIFRDLASTGDGMLTGLQLCAAMVRDGRPLAAMADAAMSKLPQVLENVRFTERPPGLLDRLASTIGAEETALGDDGRVLVRWSGTEPLLRVMVEAPTPEMASDVARRIGDAAQRIGAVS